MTFVLNMTTPGGDERPRHRWRQIGPALRGPAFLLDVQAARHIESFFNQVRLVLLGALLLLANAGMLPGGANMLVIAGIGLIWTLCVALLIRHLYRPWVAMGIALIDTLAISALIYVTGGPVSPLDALYGIVVFAAILRFDRLHSVLFTAGVVVAYLEVTWLHPSFTHELHANELATRALIMGLTAMLAWLVASEVARQRRAVVATEQQLESLRLITQISRAIHTDQRPTEIAHTAASLIEGLIHPAAVAITLRRDAVTDEVVAVGGTCGGGIAATRTPLVGELVDVPVGYLGPAEHVAHQMRLQGCQDVVATPVGPPHQPKGWIYAGSRPDRGFELAEHALMQRVADEMVSALQRAEMLELERERARSLARLAEENGRLLATERETVSRLRQLATHKDGFIDMVAHELRTPLTSIKGFAQMLLRSGRDGAAGRYSSFILAESNRLMSIIDDIVDLSRMERGLLEMRRETVDMAVLLREIGGSDLPAGARVAVDVQVERAIVLGDPEKLRQALLNLVAAGGRYHREATPMPLRLYQDDDTFVVRLCVGGQVPNQRLAHVFEYVPIEAEATRSGLGLYICKNFIEALGGKLWLESGEDEACFAFRMPSAPAATGSSGVGADPRHGGRGCGQTASAGPRQILPAHRGRRGGRR